MGATSSGEETPNKVVKGKKTSGKTSNKDKRIVRRKQEERKDKEQEEKSEYEELLKSLLNIKQGNNNEPFSELALKAMEATDNILSLKKGQAQLDSKGIKEKRGYKIPDNMIKKISEFKSKGKGENA